MVYFPGGGFVESDIAHYPTVGGDPVAVKGFTLRLFIVPNSANWDEIT